MLPRYPVSEVTAR